MQLGFGITFPDLYERDGLIKVDAAFLAFLGEAAARVGVHRDEAHVVELVRCLEQHAGRVLRFSFARRRRPRGVARGELELGRMRRLVREPGGHLARELDLGEFAAKQLLSGRVGTERL